MGKMGHIGRMVMVERDELDRLLAIADDWQDLTDSDQATVEQTRDMVDGIRARVRISGQD